MTAGQGGWRGHLRQAGRFALLAVPKAGGGVFLIALNLVLVRVLEAPDYGRFAYCMTLALLADAILGAPFDLAVIRLSGEARAGDGAVPLRAAQAALSLKLALTAALTVILAAVAAFVPILADQTGLIAATALTIVSMLVLRSVQVNLQVGGQFLAYAGVESLQLALRVAAIAALVLLLHPTAALALAALGAGTLVAAVWGGLVLQPDLFALRNPMRLPYGSLVAIAGWYLGTTALGALIGRLDVVALGAMGSADQLAMFTAGQVIASVAELVGTYLAVFLTPLLVMSMREETAASLYRRVQPALLVAAALGLAVAHAIWPFVIPRVLPAAFARAGEVALILVPGTLAGFATIPLALPLVLFRHKRALLGLDAALFPFIALAYFIAIPRHGEIGAAYVTAATMIVRSGFVQAVALWIVRRPAAPQHE